MPPGKELHGLAAIPEHAGELLLVQSLALVVTLLGCAAVVTVGLMALPRLFLQERMAQHELSAGRQLQVFARFLEQYRQTHGAYPATDAPVSDVLRHPPKGVEGYEWWYSAGMDDMTYTLDAVPATPFKTGRIRFHIDQHGRAHQCHCPSPECPPPSDWTREPSAGDPVATCLMQEGSAR